MAALKTKPLVGQKIKAVRAMTTKEMEKQHWAQDNLEMPPVVVVLEDGTKLFPAMDSEGNGHGCLFGQTKGGRDFYVTPEERA
jgi:hypothetical protein